MSPSRGPDDYDREDDDIRRLAHMIERLASRPTHSSYNESEKSTKSVVVGVGITLLAAFVIGGWKLSNSVASLEAKVAEWQKSTERRLDILERRP